MPKTRGPLLGLRASGKLGGHRRGPYAQRLITSFATADSILRGIPVSLQNSNYGAGDAHDVGSIFFGGDKTQLDRSILRFDLSSLLGRSFSRAELVHQSIVRIGSAPVNILSRCLDPSDWVESQVTWKDRSSGNPWASGGGDFDDVGPPSSVNFTCPIVLSDHAHDIMLPFVNDALTARLGILSVIVRSIDEDPPGDLRTAWNSKEGPPQHERLFLYP